MKLERELIVKHQPRLNSKGKLNGSYSPTKSTPNLYYGKLWSELTKEEIRNYLVSKGGGRPKGAKDKVKRKPGSGRPPGAKDKVKRKSRSYDK